MHPDEIRSTLTRIFVEVLGAKPEEISDATFIEDIASDSLEVTQTIMEIEAAFGVEISDKDAGSLITVADIVKLISTAKNPPQ